MARINLKKGRKPNDIKQYLGNVIIFCEGKTEKMYFSLFKSSLKKDSKYNNLIIKIANASGNAKRVLDYANCFFKEDEARNKYKNFDRYLVFDCDAPPNIREVIEISKKSSNEYKLLISNPNFELWLLMHYENVNKKLTKSQINKKLKERMNVKKYLKGSTGHISKIVGDGSRTILAIENAKKLEKRYISLEINDIKKMDPYTTVHRLMELIL